MVWDGNSGGRSAGDGGLCTRFAERPERTIQPLTMRNIGLQSSEFILMTIIAIALACFRIHEAHDIHLRVTRRTYIDSLLYQPPGTLHTTAVKIIPHTKPTRNISLKILA